ncbi:MAG: hypothetical protein EP332_03735 [Bacteroidetes bacterium]|nr:MAG: hypothetical protein EP332_03735 [Bacteroidota bacterium]
MEKLLAKLEWVLWPLIFALILVQAMGWAKVNQFLILFMGLQALLLQLNARKRPTAEAKLKKVFPILEGFGGTVVVLGSLFRLLAWPGWENMLMIGLAAVLMGLGARLFIAKPQDFFANRKSQLRYVLLLALGLGTLLMTEEQVAAYLFPGKEEVQKAFMEMQHNPEDTAAVRKYWEAKENSKR